MDLLWRKTVTYIDAIDSSVYPKDIVDKSISTDRLCSAKAKAIDIYIDIEGRKKKEGSWKKGGVQIPLDDSGERCEEEHLM